MRTRETRIRTFTGGLFWPLDPRPEDVSIYDIAGALAQKTRYGGHTSYEGSRPRHYSVAEHSVRLCDWFPADRPDLKLAALMHDSGEAYLPDICSPIKRAPEFAWFKAIEERVERAIVARFGIEHLYPWPEEVHRADKRILTDEMKELVPFGDWIADDGVSQYYGEPLGLPAHQLGWPPDIAMVMFLQRFAELPRSPC